MASAHRRITTHESLVDSLRTLSAWMRANGAPLIPDNLAPKAKTINLGLLEKKLRFSIPEGLRALWLMHDGQRKPGYGFIGPLQFLPVSWVLNERTATLALVDQLRADPSCWEESGATAEEVKSDAWLPFAARAGASLVVHGRSGRVFAGGPGSPPLVYLADSVPEWLAGYAQSVADGEFEVLEGPGDYHLAPLEPETGEQEA